MPSSLSRTLLACLLILVSCRRNSAQEAPVSITSITSAGGRVTITGRTGQNRPLVIRNAETRVRVDGQLFSTAGRPCEATPEIPLSCDLGVGLTLSLRAEKDEGALLLTASVSDSGKRRVDGFEVLSTRGSDAALELPGSAARLRYLHNGYQSWSIAGAFDMTLFSDPLPRHDDVIANPAPNGNVAFDERVGLSSHSAVIDGGDGSAMALGFVSTRLWQGAIGLETADTNFRVTAQSGFTGDSVSIRSRPVESETLFVKYESTADAAMESYGKALTRRQGTRPQAPETSQRGWFSWNRFFEGIDAEKVTAQATAMWSLLGPSIKLVEIDDGWQRAWGDWRTNDKFPPIEQLVSERRDDGQKLGLWLAPFVVEETEPIVAEHPDWWVRTHDGQPLVHSPTATSHHLRVIDATHPEALAWMVGTLSELHAKGVDFFKLDYLYAAALDGQRHDPSATGVAALTRGLQAIFGSVGDAGVNLCGVPWLHAALAPPSTIRIGPDVAYSTGPAGFALVGLTSRNMAARAFGPLAFRSDPDQFWLAPLSIEETKTALALQLLANETFALADDFSELSAEQAAAVRAAAFRNVDAVPFAPRGIFDATAPDFQPAVVETIAAPSEVNIPLPAVFVRGSLLVATNWGNAPADIDLHLTGGETVQPIAGPTPSNGKVHLGRHETGLYRLQEPQGDE
jgi:alpha-galactosidase